MFFPRVCLTLAKAFIYTFPVTLLALLPDGAIAVSLSGDSDSPNTSRTAIALFTGFGEDPANPQTGLNILNTLLQNQFGGNSARPFDSRVFTYAQSSDALNYLQSFDNFTSIGIIGYSLGGNAASVFAKNFPAPQPINLLVQIDSVGISDDKVPDNVSKGFNYFQRNPSYPGGSITQKVIERAVTQAVQKNVKGADNVNVEELFNDQSIVHIGIDNDVRLHQLIANNVNDFLINPLTPVPEATFAFRQSSFSNQASVSAAESVPEASTTLGVVMFGAFGVGSLLKRQQQQKDKVDN